MIRNLGLTGISAQIFAFIGANPGCSKKDIVNHLYGRQPNRLNSQYRYAEIDDLLAKGLIVDKGNGWRCALEVVE